VTSRVIYSCGMSVDGFIAGPGGDMQWMRPYMGGPSEVGDSLMTQTGSLLIGNRTFHGDDPNRGTEQEGAFSGQWQGQMFVLTHEPPSEPVPDVTFVTDLETGVALAREAAGGRYVSVLGADVARQCLAAGLLDEILVMVVPVLLGDGTRLFDWPGGHSVDLVQREITSGAAETALWYDVRR
jgi:dihydrofolate reductase